jgi:hypothetical protein
MCCPILPNVAGMTKGLKASKESVQRLPPPKLQIEHSAYSSESAGVVFTFWNVAEIKPPA